MRNATKKNRPKSRNAPRIGAEGIQKSARRNKRAHRNGQPPIHNPTPRQRVRRELANDEAQVAREAASSGKHARQTISRSPWKGRGLGRSCIRGRRALSPQGATFAPGFFSPGAVLEDLNGDGKLDLLLSEFSSVDFTDGFAGGIAGINNGDGTFFAVGNYEVGGASGAVFTGNFLNDNAPDAAFVSGASGTTILIAKGGSAATLTADAATIPVGGTTNLKFTLKPTLSGQSTPTGSVTLVEGGTTLAIGPLTAGSATLPVTGLATGTHMIAAIYDGDASFDWNSRATTTVTVTPAQAIALTSGASTLTLAKNQPGLVTQTVTSLGDYTGSVALSVTGAPSGVDVALNPSTVALADNGSAAVTLVVSTNSIGTTAGNATTFGGANGSTRASLSGLTLQTLRRLTWLFAFSAAVLWFAGKRRSVSCVLIRVAQVALLGAAIFSQAACGGGSSTYNGSFTLTVTAQPADTSVAPQSTAVAVTIN